MRLLLGALRFACSTQIGGMLFALALGPGFRPIFIHIHSFFALSALLFIVRVQSVHVHMDACVFVDDIYMMFTF